MVNATNTVHLSSDHPSQVWLPVVSMSEIPENKHFSNDTLTTIV